MKALFFSAVAIIVSYLAYTIFAFNKVPKSISDTYYQWADRGAKYLFTAVMWLTGLLLLPYWLSVSEPILQCLPFLSVSGMLFVGGACAFQETLTKGVHYTSAAVWASFALLYMVLTQSWAALIAGIVFGVAALVLDKNRHKHYTFWLECSCVLAMIICIGLL